MVGIERYFLVAHRLKDFVQTRWYLAQIVFGKHTANDLQCLVKTGDKIRIFGIQRQVTFCFNTHPGPRIAALMHGIVY